jgi:glycosyltransferase involved in cell wall biosynthesis
LGVAPQVYLLGLIARHEQIQLMRSALAVVQPSLFEGWSTVVEDARALGKPVIYSDIAVHLEQNPPCSVSFQRDSPESLAARLEAWWRTDKRGPDPVAENLALPTAETAALGYARRFLQIVRASLNPAP